MVTVIINFHREGYLAYLAMRSAILACQRAERNGVPSRIIAVIDKGDNVTRHYVFLCKPSIHEIYEVEFGDVSLARNFVIEKITTKYFAILDGDDLYSPDWLWRGVRFLEKYGDDNTVGHAQVRLTFGSEIYGRLQIPSNHCFFHPLHLIASWMYASDFIAPTQLFRKYPYEANKIAEGFGAEDWLWTCESLLNETKHVIIPETSYFYRRISNRISLGSVQGTTFRPTRLLNKESLADVSQNYPSASIPLTQFSGSITGPRELWNNPPNWLRNDIFELCNIDLNIYRLYDQLDTLRIETPEFFPGLNYTYLKMMDLICPDSINAIFFCECLTAQDIGLIESFVRNHAQRSDDTLNIFIVCLGNTDRADVDRLNSDLLNQRDDKHPSPVKISYLDIGTQPSFTHLWEHLKITLLIRFLLQTRPEMTVNLNSWLVDKSLGAMGKSLVTSGVTTIRICRGKGLALHGNHIFYNWYWFDQAQNNYSYAICENVEVAGWLKSYFLGNGCRVLSGVPEDKTGNDLQLGKALYNLLRHAQYEQLDNTTEIRAARSVIQTMHDARANSRNETVDISCVVTVQEEGHYLNQTLQSIAAAQEEARQQGIQTELIIIASSPSETTQCILEELEGPGEDIHVETVRYEDIGQMRNLGIRKASGQYIAYFTGTDIVSENWLAAALQTARKTDQSEIYHPEIVLTLRETFKAVLQPNMDRKSNRIELLAFNNPWIPCCFAHRNVFLDTPYMELSADSGFGHHTWLWNCETIEKKHYHKTIEGTFIYNRKHYHDRLSQQKLGTRQSITLPPTKFFSDQPWLQGSQNKRRIWPALLMTGKNVSAAIRDSEKVREALATYREKIAKYEPLLMTDKSSVQKSQSQSVQTFARSYLTFRETARQILPAGILKNRVFRNCFQMLKFFLRNIYMILISKKTVAEVGDTLHKKYADQIFHKDLSYLKMAEAYRLLKHAIADVQPTHIFIVPSLRPGGAEQHALFCIQAVTEAADSQIVLILADGNETDWQNRFPDNCHCLPFAALTQEIDFDDKIEILTRLLVNIDAPFLHLINSYLGWKTLQRHAPAIVHNKKLYISLFSIPPAEISPTPGYASFLGTLLPYLSGLLTDNEKLANNCRTLFGLAEDTICKLNHPVQAEHRFNGPSRENRIVLWAGRLDNEKRPDLLIEIAENLPHIEFHVYGTNVLGDNRHITNMQDIPNIRYCGEFTGINSIKKRPYGIFLHTSVWEGMPNMILEAMKSGLLVIAADVGGIGEVIGRNRGILIKQHKTFHKYVEAIQDVFDNTTKYHQMAEQGRLYVTQHYNKERFTDSLKHLPGYLGLASTENTPEMLLQISSHGYDRDHTVPVQAI